MLKANDISSIVTEALQSATHLSQISSNSGSRPDLDAIAYECGIKKVIRADLGSLDACLLPFSKGAVVKINSWMSRERQNFSLAHEIAHALLDKHGFYGTSQHARKMYSKTRNHTRNLEEKICDKIAAQLLMPENLFRSELETMGVSLQTAINLAKKFGSSVQATAIRLTEVTGEVCSVLYWGNESVVDGQHKLVLRWSANSTEFGRQYAPIPRMLVACDDSAVDRAFRTSKLISGIWHIDMGGLKGKCHVESKGMGPRANRYVLSLVRPN